MTLQEFKNAYETDLNAAGKTALARAFVKEFNFKSTESFRGKLKGRQNFLQMEFDWVNDNFHKFKIVKADE